MVLEALTVRVGADTGPFAVSMGRVIGITQGVNRKLASGFAGLKRNATLAATTIGATLGAVSTLGLKAFETYETGLSEISTLTNATAEEMAHLGQEQRQLAVEFGADIGPQLKATYDAISAGVADVTDATEFMTAVNRAAIAGITDQATAGEAIIRIMRAYGDEVSGAGEASDFLFKIVEKGVTTFGEFAPKIGNLAGVTANANVSIGEMSALFSTITGTAKTEQALTQAVALISNIVKPADSAKKVAAELGIGLDAVTLATRGVSGVMEQVRTQLGIAADQEFLKLINRTDDLAVVQNELGAKMGLQAAKLAELFPNLRALRGALALMSNEGKTFAENLEAMSDVSGSANTAFEKMSDTLGVRFKKALASLRDVGITIGEVLVAPFSDLIAGMRESLAVAKSWIDENRELAGQLGKVAIVVTAVSAALIPIGLIATGITSLFGALVAAGGLVVTMFGGFLGIVGALFSPLGLVVAVLGLVVAGFIDAQGGITNAWGTVKEFVIEKGQAVVSWFRENWPAIKTVAVDVFSKAWAVLQPIARGLFDFVVEMGGNVVKWFRENWPEIKETFAVVWQHASDFWDRVGKPLWETISSVVKSTWEVIKNVVRTGWKVVSKLFEAGSAFLRGDFDAFWEAIGGAFNAALDGISKYWDLMWDGLKSAANSLGPLVLSSVQWVLDTMQRIWQRSIDFIVDAFKRAWQFIKGIIDDVGAGLGFIGGAIADLFSDDDGGQSFPLGGPVRGRGAQRATVHGGEFVVDAGTTSALGADFLRGLQDFARGGGAPPALGGGGSVVVESGAIVIHGAGRDAEEIAEMVLERIDDATARGHRNTRRRGDR